MVFTEREWLRPEEGEASAVFFFAEQFTPQDPDRVRLVEWNAVDTLTDALKRMKSKLGITKLQVPEHTLSESANQSALVSRDANSRLRDLRMQLLRETVTDSEITRFLVVELAEQAPNLALETAAYLITAGLPYSEEVQAGFLCQVLSEPLILEYTPQFDKEYLRESRQVLEEELGEVYLPEGLY